MRRRRSLLSPLILLLICGGLGAPGTLSMGMLAYAGPNRNGPGEFPQDTNRPAEKANAMLIEPVELQKRLNDSNWRILDTRAKEDYAKGHIPGAVWVDVAAWQKLGKAVGGFRDAKGWGKQVDWQNCEGNPPSSDRGYSQPYGTSGGVTLLATASIKPYSRSWFISLPSDKSSDATLSISSFVGAGPQE